MLIGQNRGPHPVNAGELMHLFILGRKGRGAYSFYFCIWYAQVLYSVTTDLPGSCHDPAAKWLTLL